MAVDRGYGSGNKNTGMKKPVSPRAASAGLRRTGIKAAAKKYTNITTSKAKSVAGSSEYVQRENAARAQLGTAGVSARARQLPAAARAFTKEMTGVDISRKGVKVDPFGVAMALPVGKVLKAARVLRAAGKTAAASALRARVLAKESGRNLPKTIALAEKMWTRTPGSSAPTPQTVGKTLLGKLPREASESVFPRLPSGGGVPGAKRSFDIYEDPLLEGAGRFARGTKRGNKLAKAIEKNEVQQGFYIGSREAIKRAAFNSTRPRSNLPKAK